MTQLSQELLEQNKTKNVWPMVGDAVDFHWEWIWGLFKDVPGHVNLYTESYTFQQVKSGHWQVWAYSDSEIRGIMATRVNVFPRAKVLDVIGVSGISGLDFMKNLDDLCESLARQQGCQYLTTLARPGMERVLGRKHRAIELYSVLVRPVGLLRRS